MALVCPNCGVQRSVEQRFCEQCGLRFSSATPDGPAQQQRRAETFDAGMLAQQDLDAAAQVMVRVVEERGEHAYIHRTPRGVTHTDRTGTTLVTTVAAAGRAELGSDGNSLLLDGHPLGIAFRTRSYRQVVCLMRASIEGPQGQRIHYNVVPFDLLSEAFDWRKTGDHLVERTDEELVAAMRGYEERDHVVRVFAVVPATGGSGQKNGEKPTLEEALAELDGLIGLAEVKEEVRKLTNLVRVRKMREERGMSVPPMSFHLVFTGNPGTGKTTVARLLAQIYRALGMLEKGQLVEVGRSDLVAGYIGQTAKQTQEKITEALGGVMFVDEAYALSPEGAGGQDFGREAVDTLVKAMEDHREDLVVIVAGYTEPMRHFVASNPGLKSRFGRTILFPDYGPADMVDIFDSMLENDGYRLEDAARAKAYRLFGAMHEQRDETFGNARDVRNVYEAAITSQMDRVAAAEEPTDDMLSTILAADVPGTDDPFA